MLRDSFQFHFYKQDLMNICQQLLETYTILCVFLGGGGGGVGNLHMILQGCVNLSLMLISKKKSDFTDSLSLYNIIVLV